MRDNHPILSIKKEWIVKETDKAIGVVTTDRGLETFQNRGYSYYIEWIPKTKIIEWTEKGLKIHRSFKLSPELEDLITNLENLVPQNMVPHDKKEEIY
jgi:hypothetical protein